jgi:hypothetical protein
MNGRQRNARSSENPESILGGEVRLPPLSAWRGRLSADCFRHVGVRDFFLFQETYPMRLHQKLVAPLACALALVLWGCNSEQVESGADSTAKGLDKAGGAIERGTGNLGKKIEHAGEGTKLEGAANATGHMLEKGGEGTHKVLDKAGDKIIDAAPGVGKAVDKAGDKIKDLKEKTVEGAKNLGEKIKDKASDVLNKDKDTDKDTDKDAAPPKS